MKIQIIVKLNCQQFRIIESDNGSLIVYLKLPPVPGKANKELIAVLAQKY